MGVADLIISGALKKKKKEENTYNVKDGTYTAEAVKSTNKKVKDTVDTFNNVSDRIKSNTTMSFDDDNKTYKTKSTITDEKKQNKTKKENAKKTFDFSADDESVIKPSLKGEDLTKTDKKNIYNQYKTLSDKQDKLVDKQRGKNSKKVLEEYSQLDKERKEKWKNPSITLDEALDKNSVYTKNYGKEELSNAVSKKDKDKLSDLTNTQKYTTYLKNAAYEDTKESTALDKVFGPLAQAGGLVTGLTKILPSTRYKDENGNYIYLPNKLDLYTQRVQNDYDTKFGKFYGDVAGGASKIAASELVNLAAPGVGSGLYYGSMFGENIADANNKQVNLNGKNDGARTLINAGIKTGLEFLTGKFLGSATKGLTGGTASELEKGISNKVYNKLSKLGIEDSTLKTFASNLTGKVGSEGTEEFSQNYLENMTDIITLGSDGKHTNILKMLSDPDVLSDAIYAGLVGGATGGLFGAVSGDASNVDIRMNQLNLFKSALQEDINNTTDVAKKEKLQGIINNIDKNLQTPFSIEENALQGYQDELINQNLNVQQPINQMQPQISTQTPLNQINQGISEQNVETPYQLQNEQITPLNQVNQELQETRKNDIADSVQAMNLEKPQEQKKNGIIESAKKYNIEQNETINSINNFLNERGLKAEFNEEYFKDENGNPIEDQNAFWRIQKNSNGKVMFDKNGKIMREVILNPYADSQKTLENITIHEMFHDMFSDSNNKSASQIYNEILNYARKNTNFDEAKVSLENLYKNQYKNEYLNNKQAFDDMINEEAVADILGNKLGDTEFIESLVKQNRNIAQRFYDAIVSFLNKLNKKAGYKSEKLFWQDIKNKYAKALQTEYSNELRNSNQKYSISKNTGKLQENGKDVTLETSKTGNTGTLMAMHNLSEDKFNGIMDLGGAPVPSIAITNPNIVNHNQFGDGTLLFNKSTIDPAVKTNEVYDRDVWSPTFPTVESEIIKENLEKVADEIGIRDYYLEDYAERHSNIDDLIYTVLKEDDVVNKYLDENNINYDKNLSRKEIRQQAIDNGIEDYLKDKLGSIYGEKGIYNGKEYITPSGNRRTFWQTHDKYNLENIVKVLKRKPTVNGQETSIFSGGFGNIQANMYQKFNTIQDIKNAEGRIKATADEDIKTLQDNLSNSISELTEYYGGYTSSNPFTTFSKVSEDIVDFAAKKEQNKSTLKEMLDEYGYKEVPDSLLNKIVKDINDLKNIPTDYFEAKPQRAVGLDEIQMAVIPNRWSTETKQRLTDKGIPYVEYDPNIEGDRQRVINQFDDLKFSKDASKWQEYLDKNFANSGKGTRLKDINKEKQQKTTKPTTEIKTSQGKPKNISKQSYLTSAEQEELETLKELDNKGFLEETDADYKRLQELEKKSQGITTKFPELKAKNTFDDIKSIYGKYKNNEISKSNKEILNQAKNFIEANKQGRRTKEQWLQVAEFIGNNADIKSSQDLQQLAMETWFETKPNNSNVLNRQGQKYVKFPVNEWVDAVYKGAGVGTDVKMSIEENNTKSQKEVKKPKNSVEDSVKAMNLQNKQLKQEIKDTNKALNLEKENIKYSAEDKIEKSVRNQYKGLSEDKIQQIIELKEEQKNKDKMYSNFSNKQRAKQRIMINAYETNAKIRKIVQGDSLQKVEGGLTDTELEKAIEKENSNYIGKKVTVNGQNGTVVGNPYGRVKVEFEDGTTKTFDRDEVKSMNETKRNKIVEAKDIKGNKVDLKPNGNNTYEQVNVKPKKTDVIPDMSNKVLNIGNEKVSNFYSNITEKSKFITEENRETLKDNANLKYYDAITNKDTLQNAMNKLDKNTEQQVGDFFAKKDFNAEDVATGWILVKRYQDAGNFEAMSSVIDKMREQGTKAGQAVQAYGILQRLTPEGMEYYSQKQLDKAFNEYSKNKSKKQIEKYAKDFTLTAEEHQFIKDTMKKVEKMKDEEAKKVEIAKIVSMLSDKMPPERGQRLKAWMRISMLGNPKTQVRNVAGNAIIQPVNWVGDIFAATADKIMAKQTGKRTIGTTDFGALARGTKQGLKDAIRDAKTGVDTRDINLDRFEENIGSKPFYEGHNSKLLNTAAKALNKTNKILGNIMSGGDRIFYQGIYENSLANQMKLNNVTKPTQEMKNIAEQEALSRTWNDSNEYTKAVLQIRNAMNKLNVKGYGLGDVLVPFAKTPANLTKAIVDYSPVGLTRSILQDGKNYKNSLENGQYSPELQHKFAESLGKGMAGSLLYVAAAALAKAGITSGASDDDKDVANFMRNTLGIQPYSVKIGDKSFTYDWAQPIAAPFAIMADAKRISEKENQELGDIITTATSSASNILLEQSFLSSIQDVFNSYEGPSAAIKQQIQDLPARATPTFFKQIADLIDPTSRQTFVKGNEKETLKNKVQVKIPGASKELVSQRDTLGREIQKYGGDEDKLKYAFNVFLNPANTNKGKTSQAAEEIYSIYKATGDKTIMPRQVGYSENIGGSIRNLTAKERNELQKLSGQKIEENVKALTQSSKYNSMSNEDKAAVINGIVNYSFAKAKSDLFDTNISTMYKTAAKKEEQGIPLYDYYINRVSKRR